MCQGSLGFDEIGAALASTGGAPFTNARMIGHIMVIKTSIAFVAKVGFAEESIEELHPS